MKRSFLYQLFIIVFAFSFFSCGKEDDDKTVPLPDDPKNSPAYFYSNRTFIEKGEEIVFQFRGNGIPVSNFEWDFGNGQNSTDSIAKITFNDLGKFNVKLTVKDSLNQSYSSTITITVGKKYLTSIVIQEISFKDKQGNPWDVSDGPDLLIRMSREYHTYQYTYRIADNVTPDMLPITFAVPDTFSLGNLYLFELKDAETTTTVGSVFMANFSGFSANKPEKNYKNGIGMIEAYSKDLVDSYTILLYYQVK